MHARRVYSGLCTSLARESGLWETAVRYRLLFDTLSLSLYEEMTHKDESSPGIRITFLLADCFSKALKELSGSEIFLALTYWEDLLVTKLQVQGRLP